MGGAVPAVVTLIGGGLGATAGAAAGAGPDGEDATGEGAAGAGPDDDDAAGGGAAGEDATSEDATGTTVDTGEGPARTGRNRCRECRRKGERYCRHPLA